MYKNNNSSDKSGCLLWIIIAIVVASLTKGNEYLITNDYDGMDGILVVLAVICDLFIFGLVIKIIIDLIIRTSNQKLNKRKSMQKEVVLMDIINKRDKLQDTHNVITSVLGIEQNVSSFINLISMINDSDNTKMLINRYNELGYERFCRSRCLVLEKINIDDLDSFPSNQEEFYVYTDNLEKSIKNLLEMQAKVESEGINSEYILNLYSGTDESLNKQREIAVRRIRIKNALIIIGAVVLLLVCISCIAILYHIIFIE